MALLIPPGTSCRAIISRPVGTKGTRITHPTGSAGFIPPGSPGEPTVEPDASPHLPLFLELHLPECQESDPTIAMAKTLIVFLLLHLLLALPAARGKDPADARLAEAVKELRLDDVKFAAIMKDGKIARVLKGKKDAKYTIDKEGEWLYLVREHNFLKFRFTRYKIKDDAIRVIAGDEMVSVPMWDVLDGFADVAARR
jgi:hypothetical protein